MVAQAKFERQHRVENDVGVRGAGDHAEIVDGDVLVDAAHELRYALARFGGELIVGHDGVHVDGGGAAELAAEPLLDVVDLVVQRHDVAVRGDLGVERDHHAAGAVVVHDEVVDALHDGRGENDLLDPLDKFRRGRLTEQGRDGVPRGLNACPEHERCDDDTAPAVDLKRGEVPDERRGEDGGGRRAVGETVHRGRLHRGGADLLADRAVIEIHIELDEDGGEQDAAGEERELHRLGVQDLLHRALGKLDAHEENDHGDDQARDVLQPPVAEGMLGVGLLSRKLEAEQRHDARARIGEVDEGVRRDGDGAGERASEQLECEEQQIEADAHDAAEHPVGLPHGRRGDVLAVFDEFFGQQRDHTGVSLPLDFAGKKKRLVKR